MKPLIIACLILTSCAWSTQEKVAGAFFLAAHTANYYSTEKALDNPNNHENNPILDEHPSDRKCLVYFSLTGVGALIVAHIWKDARQWILWGYGTVNAGCVVYDRGLD